MSGLVIEVTDSSFEQEILRSTLPVVLDFWAAWCGPCKALAPVLEKLATEYNGKVKFAKMNVDENPRTPDQFGVRGIPMLVFFKEGQALDSIVGNQDREVIVESLKKIL
ncbi:MAG TPA: thioredoxin [Oligoflexia bacterium]|nr:thioredoxin [Oligoflexia bacterium]HMP27917.1 thioredoxin [Oligoflexia bacterium]